jgi:16S rRNA (cytosine1402-N4)-methyltransferase
MTMQGAPHIPVLLDEVLAALAPVGGETYVDGTLGAGGYTRAILDKADCRVIAIDRDETAHEMAKVWKDKYGDRLILVHGAFSDMEELLRARGIDRVDAVVLDLGVSSMQIDQDQRGFSFRFDGPLDMRMDRSCGETAADIVNTLPEKELADIIYQYGEERHSRRIAAAIVRARAESRIETTLQLAEIVRAVVHVSPKDKIDPATRTFQALRLAVNDELGELRRALEAAEHILNDGGRLVVVTFHSLEDRIVKEFLAQRSKPAPSPSRHLPDIPSSSLSSPPLTFLPLTKKPVAPSDAEMKRNPRARSAKLRAAIRRRA